MKTDHRLTIGSLIGPYKIVRLIGKGGMGEVYEAYEESLHRRVALKVVSKEQSDDPEIVKRFDNEGKALARVSHPNVVGVYSLDHHMGIHYIAMEFVEGPSLDEYLQKRVFSAREAMPLFIQLLNGVMTLHKNGIIHRDLKPKNIIYQSNHSVKIVDFGVVKMLRESNLELTRVGMVVGSIKYLSPEVATGKPASPQSDIWSLGIIFYEMLIGSVPFTGKNYFEVLDKIKTQELDFPEATQMWIPREIREIITKMCSKDIEERYVNVQQILFELERLAKQPQFRTTPVVEDVTAAQPKRVANENSIRARIKQAGFKDSEIKMLMTAALDNQMRIDRAKPALERPAATPDSDEVEISATALREAVDYFRSGKVAFKEPFEAEARSVSPWPRQLAIGSATVALSLALLVGWNYVRHHLRRGNSTPSQIAKPRVVLQYPTRGERIWVNSNDLLRFVWGPPVAENTANLQIALDESFQEIILDEGVSGSQYAMQMMLDEGPYYWRLVAGSETEMTPLSPPQPFAVLFRTPPQPLSPLAGAHLHDDKTLRPQETVPVTLEWQPKSLIKNYRVQVARDPAFASLLVDQPINGSKLPSQALAAGAYHWRVSTYESTPIDSLWSPAQEFIVAKSAPEAPTPAVEKITPVAGKPKPPLPPPSGIAVLGRPSLLNAKNQMTLKFKVGRGGRGPASTPQVENEPVLQWQPLKGVSKYQVQVSRDEEFLRDSRYIDSASPRLALVNPEPGTLFWRVRGVGRDGKTGPFSAPGRLKLLLPPPTLADPPVKREVIPVKHEKGRPIPYVLAWNEVPKASGYQILVSEERSFKRPLLVENSTRGSAKIPIPREGTYFFKVAAVDRAGQLVSLYSKPTRLNLESREPKIEPARLAVPRIQIPSDGTTILTSGSSRPPIVFMWTKVDEASQYKLQYSLDKDFNSVFYEKSLAEDQFLLDKDFPAGRIYWRVRAEKGATPSAWTKPHSFEIPVSR